MQSKHELPDRYFPGMQLVQAAKLVHVVQGLWQFKHVVVPKYWVGLVQLHVLGVEFQVMFAASRQLLHEVAVPLQLAQGGVQGKQLVPLKN